MPAIERAFSSIPPNRLYIDTDIFVSYFVSSQPHHERCNSFIVRLVALGLTTVYISSLVWLELLHVVSQERFRATLSRQMRAEFRLDRWEESAVRRRYVEWFVELLTQLLSDFEWVEISLTPEVRSAATAYMAQYNLGSQDAIHLASAVGEGVHDLASFDRQFRRVGNLFLWNDLVHTEASMQP
ncbi:MAG: type II toxin-antitoxin system VapC family toxin [Dehalococcoidia bacterium]